MPSLSPSDEISIAASRHDRSVRELATTNRRLADLEQLTMRKTALETEIALCRAVMAGTEHFPPPPEPKKPAPPVIRGTPAKDMPVLTPVAPKSAPLASRPAPAPSPNP